MLAGGVLCIIIVGIFFVGSGNDTKTAFVDKALPTANVIAQNETSIITVQPTEEATSIPTAPSTALPTAEPTATAIAKPTSEPTAVPDTKTISLKDGATIEVPYGSEYCGSKRSEVFHHIDCKHVSDIAAHNFVVYDSRDDAIAKGKRPCKNCNP